MEQVTIKKISDVVKSKRLSLKLTQAQAATLCKMSKRNYIGVEKAEGGTRPCGALANWRDRRPSTGSADCAKTRRFKKTQYLRSNSEMLEKPMIR